jgi:hypothetical protein
MTELPSWRDMWEPSCRPTHGTSGQRFGSRARNTLCHLVSVVDDTGQLRVWPLWWHLSQAWHGPALLDNLPGRGVRNLTLGKIPEGGLQIDVSRKTLGAWQTADTMGIFQALPDLWSGWHTECWEDRFEEQALRCKGALRIPELDLATGVDSAQEWIRSRVFQCFADTSAGQILKLAELLAPVGHGLVVSDDALADTAVRPTKAKWSSFADACNLQSVCGGQLLSSPGLTKLSSQR